MLSRKTKLQYPHRRLAISFMSPQPSTAWVVCCLCGGVDSAVVAALLHEAIGGPRHDRNGVIGRSAWTIAAIVRWAIVSPPLDGVDLRSESGEPRLSRNERGTHS
jgi:hypothetical protein